MKRVSIIKHNGVSISFLNANGVIDIDEFCQYLEEITNLSIDNNINSILIDIENAFMAPKVRQTTKKESERAKAHFGKVYTAISGLKGMQRVIANLLNKDEYFAKSIDDAKDWLVSKI